VAARAVGGLMQELGGEQAAGVDRELVVVGAREQQQVVC